MAVHVVTRSITSNQTEHYATSVGDGGWVVSFLPGRTLDIAQATAAIQVAEVAPALAAWARLLGLTTIEAVGMVALARIEPNTPPGRPFRRLARR